MRRRTFIRGGSAATMGALGASSTVTANSHDTIADTFFDAMRRLDEDEIEEAILGCASGICGDASVSSESTEAIVEDVDLLNHHIRRIRFGIRILNEYDITTAIDESMVQEKEELTKQATRFIPLVGSFNNLQSAACAVDNNPNADLVEDFIYALLSFGLEVGLWHSTMPYQMAWSGTRFTANRTFLRYAKNGCNGCIAFVMSELHWALRAVPYNIVSEESLKTAATEINRLADEMRELEGFVVDIDLNASNVEDMIRQPIGGGMAPIVPSATHDERPPILVIALLAGAALLLSRD